MTARSVRLILKQFRFELTAIVAVLLASATVGLVVMARLPDLQAQIAACGDAFRCEGLVEDAGRMQSLGGLVSAIASIVGAFGGIVLGVAVVGREVERGTAALAWSLARSRRRWLLGRAVLVALVLAVAALIPALVADRLVPILFPGYDATAAFVGSSTRGWLPVGRDLAAFALGILAGAAFGRVLPGLLLGLILAAAVNLAISEGVVAWRTADAVAITVEDSGQVYERDLILDTRYRDADGNLLSIEEIYARVPNGEPPPGWPDSVYQTVNIGIPGVRYPEIDHREAAMWALVGAILLAGSVLVVERRRPY